MDVLSFFFDFAADYISERFLTGQGDLEGADCTRGTIPIG